MTRTAISPRLAMRTFCSGLVSGTTGRLSPRASPADAHPLLTDISHSARVRAGCRDRSPAPATHRARRRPPGGSTPRSTRSRRPWPATQRRVATSRGSAAGRSVRRTRHARPPRPAGRAPRRPRPRRRRPGRWRCRTSRGRGAGWASPWATYAAPSDARSCTASSVGVMVVDPGDEEPEALETDRLQEPGHPAEVRVDGHRRRLGAARRRPGASAGSPAASIAAACSTSSSRTRGSLGLAMRRESAITLPYQRYGMEDHDEHRPDRTRPGSPRRTSTPRSRSRPAPGPSTSPARWRAPRTVQPVGAGDLARPDRAGLPQRRRGAARRRRRLRATSPS